MIDISNDGLVLHLRSETVAILKWMNITSDDNDDQMISRDECGPNFLTSVLQMRKNLDKKNRKLIRSGIEPGPAA